MPRTLRSPFLHATLVASLTGALAASAAPATSGHALPAQPSLSSWSSARSASEAALARLATTSPQLRAQWRPGQVGPSLVTGLREQTPAGSPEARARAFLEANAALVGATAGRADIALGSATMTSAAGRVVVSFPQAHGQTEVWGRGVKVTLDERGTVLTLTSDLAPVTEVAAAAVSIDDARRVAANAAGAPAASAGRRVIVAGPQGAFEAAVFFAAPAGTLAAREIVVGLHDGRVASVLQAVHH